MLPSDSFRQRLLDDVRRDSLDASPIPERLEGRLTPLVRMALRKGLGAPALVNWVRDTHTRISDGSTAGPAESWTPQITRLLCAALLHEPRPGSTSRPRNRDPLATW